MDESTMARRCHHPTRRGASVPSPLWLAEAGLTAIGVRAFTLVDRDPTGFAATMAERRAAIARQAGAITEDELQS